MKKRKRRGVPSGGSSWRNMKTKQNRQPSQDTDAPSPQYWWPDDGPQMNCVWFYIPLRIPLKLPDRFFFPMGSPYDIDYPREELTDLIGFAGDPGNPIGVSVSICIHQIEGSANDPQMEAARAAFGRRPGLNRPVIDSDNRPIVTTVLECVTSLGDTSPDDIEDALTPAFDKVVCEVNNFLRGYMLLTQNRVVLVQKETLPSGVLAEWRLGHESGPGPREPLLFLVNVFDDLIMSTSAKREEPLSEEEVGDMLMHSYVLADPMMAAIHTMTLDAQLARQRGEYAVAVVLAASGLELLLRLLLELLLWENGVSPRDAIPEICAPSGVGHAISYLLKSKFHNRLGGTWDISATSNPVGRMYEAVFERRNSYLHTATPITSSDADSALGASADFLEFIHTQLKAHIKRYPLAAHMLIGEPIITDTGLRDKIDAALIDKETRLPLSPLMPSSTEHLRAYRQEIRDHQESNRTGASLTGEINELTHVAALIYPDGSVEYWLIDPDRAVACRAKTPDMSIEQERLVKKSARKAKRQPSNWLNTCRLLDISAKPLESQPEWVSAYEVWRMEHKQN